nr:AAA family ATPase [Pseudomonas mediterranea]
MARIRRFQIQNFRSIQNLDWTPSPGFNCLIGPGDSGKSSILDAINLCLGARRNAPFGDTDFYHLGQNWGISETYPPENTALEPSQNVLWAF